jgi:MFS family permease
MNNINPKAIIVGTVVYALIYAVHILILPLLKNSLDMGEGGAMFAVSQMLGVATCFISGYVSARIAGERGFFYGFNVGALGTVLSGLAAAAFSLLTGARMPMLGLRTLPFWIFVNGSLAGFAGLLVIDMVEEGKRES